MRSSGSKILAAGWSSQKEIAASASVVESEISNTRGFVAILRKAHGVSQAKRTRLRPFEPGSACLVLLRPRMIGIEQQVRVDEDHR
jgi:hypothetical protein